MATKKTTGKQAAAKKTGSRRKPAATSTQRIEQMTGGVVVGGSISAKRDVIMRDQIKRADNRMVQISTAGELVAELDKVRAQIAALKQAPELDAGDRQTVAVIEGRVVEAQTEAAKPEPDGNRVVTMLDKAGKTMTALGAGVTGAIALGETIGKLAPYLEQATNAARKLFGLG